MIELNNALEQITALNSTINAFETTVGMITEVVLKAGVYRPPISRRRRLQRAAAANRTATFASFDRHTVASDVRLIGEGGSVELVADLQQLPLFHVSPGAPPLLLRSLIFRGGTTQPIIVIEGGDVTLEGCTFVDNAASAVEIRGGRLLVRGSNFANNRGQGAISARGDAQG